MSETKWGVWRSDGVWTLQRGTREPWVAKDKADAEREARSMNEFATATQFGETYEARELGTVKVPPARPSACTCDWSTESRIRCPLHSSLRSTPIWCDVHQHYKWCEHNGGIMGATGYEAPPLRPRS